MIHVDFKFVNYNGLEDSHPDLVPTVICDDSVQLDGERLLHQMNQAQLEVAICKYLGLSSSESATILQYRNRRKIYKIEETLRDFYKMQKQQVLGYN